MLAISALLIGIVAGLRAMTAPAAVSWAAYFGILNLTSTPFAVFGSQWTAWIFTAGAIAELIGDQLPQTPSRKVPLQFATRIVMGALCGAALGAAGDAAVIGLIAGAIGAVLGTYGGAEARARLATLFGRDPPAALIEDAVAVVGAALIVGLI
ncbi:DUF4126 family protein [Rhizobiaceae bacterium n13]|uniref:DUF4126 family protein n=1 Tax=Ferirhizobium litorale TaxID=2927786 RepID=A0AAE3U230_9HYPH|nr:DUF4126 family protein [Fererhizobium litorale]MDI7863169.1 DUF4126 family protein [Fererhizobium litorale]MDI7923096.1 DUF4126 family protein [Fererhizobium litorale]